MNRLRKEVKILALSLALGLVFAISVAAYSYVYSVAVQEDIASNVIRFHVQANSDSEADQEIKDIVRDELLSEFEGIFNQIDNVKESRQIIKNELPAIQAHAKATMQQLGLDYEVDARMERVFFPTKTYGELSFPPGVYEALQITIGTGTGQNWWCLMFPPLCFVDMTSTDSGRQQLADTVSDESFRLLTHQEEGSGATAEVRFRVVEWWQSRRRNDVQPSHLAGR
ncbi:MAG: stage II sporulation protein R [Defluviitaleaceae bacterium]|nr:stage II sporulation protein R [Defluviitaleaceae bacterium]